MSDKTDEELKELKRLLEENMPDGLDVIRKQVKHSENYAKTLLAIYVNYLKNKSMITAKELNRILRKSPAYCFQVLEQFVHCGLLRKVVRGTGRGSQATFIVRLDNNPNPFSKSLINEAKKWFK